MLETYNILRKFSGVILSLGDEISDNRLAIFEDEIDYKLPSDFKFFLSHHNGINLAGTEVYGLGKEFKDSSLDIVYKFEHYEAGNPMPKRYLPFSPDVGGNHYCLDLERFKDENCPIVFWQHDIQYTDILNIETCNTSFTDWIKEVMIEWTLEDYNYDGTEI